MDSLHFYVYFLDKTNPIPPGYLFLCPFQDLHEVSGRFSTTHPHHAGYWSLEPTGVDRLTPEEATSLGFPELELSVHVGQGSWDESVYAGLRQFHAGKGFDPTGQGVVEDLGLPLYQLSAQERSSLADVEDRGYGEVPNDRVLNSVVRTRTLDGLWISRSLPIAMLGALGALFALVATSRWFLAA
ncbi:hypothetical protein B0H16DRAFT_361133 [Mycena metata]|uniref:Uncharacterized protein n=1 Tax=Mycena metata TaxID=1033252 RepID=A0AAD7HKN8_9AGAR|nr:hypothetical protein B0H16DRAFT_361133 [Mycena metata]